MPLPTPLIKVSATRGYGADVILHGANYDEAYEEALRRSREDGLTLVHAFDDDAVIAGQGSLGWRFCNKLQMSKRWSSRSAAVG